MAADLPSDGRQRLTYKLDRNGVGHVCGIFRIHGRDHRIELTLDPDGFRALREMPLSKLSPLLHGLARYPTYNHLLPAQDGRKKPRGNSAAGLQAWRTAREIGPTLRAWAEKVTGTRDETYAAAVKQMKRGRSPSPLTVAAYLVELNCRNAGMTWPGKPPFRDPEKFFQRLTRHKEEPANTLGYSAGFDRSHPAKSILAGKHWLVFPPAPFTIGP